MKRIFYLLAALLGLGPLEMALADVKFKIEMQNYTDAELKFYCKSITGVQKWVFPKGSIIVPPRTSVTEDVEIARSSQGGSHEEIQCGYSGQGLAVNATGFNGQGAPLRIIEKTTDSVAIDASFGGVLTLVVNPAVFKNTEAGQILDTHSEFMVSFEDR